MTDDNFNNNTIDNFSADDVAGAPVANDDSNMTDEEALNLFVDQLLAEKGVENPDEFAKQDLKDRLIVAINQEVLEALPEEKLDEIDKMLDGDRPSREEISKVVEDSGVDAAALTEQAMTKFREEYLKGDVTEETPAEKVEETAVEVETPTETDFADEETITEGPAEDESAGDEDGE